MNLHKLGTSLGPILKQLYFFFLRSSVQQLHISTSYSSVSPPHQCLEEEPTFHFEMRHIWLGISGATQKPPRLGSAMNCWQLLITASTMTWVLHRHGLRECWPRKKAPLQNGRLQTWLKFEGHEGANCSLETIQNKKIIPPNNTKPNSSSCFVF